MNTEADRKAREEARANRERAKRESPENEREFREELAHWERIKNSKNPDDFYDFLLARPSGFMSEQAQFRLDQISKPGVEPEPAPGYPRPLPSGARRYEVGDEEIHDVTDKLTRTVTRVTMTVISASDDRVEFRNIPLVLDQMGAMIQDFGGGVKKPPRLIMPANLALGKHWRTAFHDAHRNGWEGDVTWDYRVEAFESVTVPAGTIRAFRIEGNGWAIYTSSRGSSRIRETRWIDPTVMRAVRTEREDRDYSGTASNYFSTVLVRLTLAPR